MDDRWTIRLCGECGRNLDGATACLGTVTQRHAPSGGRLVEVAPAARVERLEAALLECAKQAGADTSEPPRPGTNDLPPLEEWAVRCVKELRGDYETASDETLQPEDAYALGWRPPAGPD